VLSPKSVEISQQEAKVLAKDRQHLEQVSLAALFAFLEHFLQQVVSCLIQYHYSKFLFHYHSPYGISTTFSLQGRGVMGHVELAGLFVYSLLADYFPLSEIVSHFTLLPVVVHFFHH